MRKYEFVRYCSGVKGHAWCDAGMRFLVRKPMIKVAFGSPEVESELIKEVIEIEVKIKWWVKLWRKIKSLLRIV